MSEETCPNCRSGLHPTGNYGTVYLCPRHAKVAELECKNARLEVDYDGALAHQQALLDKNRELERQVAQLREALEDCVYDQCGDGTPAEYTVWAAAKKVLDATREQPKETL